MSKLKEALSAPISLHSHATTGMSTAAIVKAVEAGADMADAAISSMSHTYGHSATESVVAILEGGDRDTGMDLGLLEEIASYFRGVRKKYAKFEGSLRGIDARILTAQVPGGMLTNMENQLREQGATDRFDEVLEEMPSVREELGFIPLVTPTSQIVGTQSIVNVLSGERYKTITRQTAGVLRGEYGRTPAPVDADLQKRALDGDDPVTCRPADRISPGDGEADRRGGSAGEGRGVSARGRSGGRRPDLRPVRSGRAEVPEEPERPVGVRAAALGGGARGAAGCRFDRGSGRRLRHRSGPIPGQRQRNRLRRRGQPRGRRRLDPAGPRARFGAARRSAARRAPPPRPLPARRCLRRSRERCGSSGCSPGRRSPPAKSSSCSRR